MSNRTLVELNHDYCSELTDAEFAVALRRYLRSADIESAENLQHYGPRVISMRHHSGVFHIRAGEDGFAVREGVGG